MYRNQTTWQKIYRSHWFVPLACLAVVLLSNWIITFFLTDKNFFSITFQNGVLYGRPIDIINRASELIIIALGMTLVVASSGGTDISVGAVCTVAGAVAVFALNGGERSADTYAVPFLVAFLLAMLAGTACGAWNGFLVAKMRIQPMVATLILFTAGRGIAQLITNGQIMYMDVPSFQWLGSFLPGIPLPTPVLLAALIVILTSCILRFTALGMQVQAVGINRKASRLVGFKSSRIIFLAYLFCGLCAGIAGMVMVSRVHSIDANNAGLLIELDAILAVALGGNSLAGGKFSLAGSVIGAITIQALTTFLYAVQVKADQLPIYKAVVVIIIVAIQSPEAKRFVRKSRYRLSSWIKAKKGGASA